MNDGIDRDPQQYFKRANTKEPARGGAKKVRFGENPTAKQVQQPEPEQDAVSGRVFDFEKEPKKLNELVSDVMKDIQEKIELQSLVNDAMAEFQGIHQEMERQKERDRLAEKQRQKEKERQRIAEQKQQKPDKGWSFSR